MTKGITGKEPDPRVVYADIIDLPRHVSDHHPNMSLYDRAAQFSPYAALTGYDDLVKEEARQVDQKIDLGDEELAQLNARLNEIRRETEAGERPEVSVTYFIPDPLKNGGRYETIRDRVRKVDPVRQVIQLEKKTGASGARMEISIADILLI